MIWYGMSRTVTGRALGLIPSFLSDDDPRPAREQIDERYQHGGGWRPLPKAELAVLDGLRLQFADDPPINPIAVTRLRDEMIVLYEHEILAIFQPDYSFEASRID